MDFALGENREGISQNQADQDKRQEKGRKDWEKESPAEPIGGETTEDEESMSVAAPSKPVPGGTTTTSTNTQKPPPPPKPKAGDKIKVTNPNGVNIRSGPGTNNSITGGLTQNQTVTSTTLPSGHGNVPNQTQDKQGNWWDLIQTSNGKKGWIEVQTASGQSYATDLSAPGTANKPGPGPSPAKSWQQVAQEIRTYGKSNGFGSANQGTINQDLSKLSPADLQNLFDNANGQGLNRQDLLQWGLDLNGQGYGTFGQPSSQLNSGTRSTLATMLAQKLNGKTLGQVAQSFATGNMANLLGQAVAKYANGGNAISFVRTLSSFPSSILNPHAYSAIDSVLIGNAQLQATPDLLQTGALSNIDATKLQGLLAAGSTSKPVVTYRHGKAVHFTVTTPNPALLTAFAKGFSQQQMTMAANTPGLDIVQFGRQVAGLQNDPFGMQQKINFVQGVGLNARTSAQFTQSFATDQVLASLIGHPSHIVQALKGFGAHALSGLYANESLSGAPSPKFQQQMLGIFATDGNHLGSFANTLVNAETTTGAKAQNFSDILSKNLPPGGEQLPTTLQQAFLDQVTSPGVQRNDPNFTYGQAALDLMRNVPAAASWALTGGLPSGNVDAFVQNVTRSTTQYDGINPVYGPRFGDAWSQFNGILAKLSRASFIAFGTKYNSAFKTLVNNGAKLSVTESVDGMVGGHAYYGPGLRTPLINVLINAKLPPQDQYLAAQAFTAYASNLVDSSGTSYDFRDAVARLFATYPIASVMGLSYTGPGTTANGISGQGAKVLNAFINNEFMTGGSTGAAQLAAGRVYSDVITQLLSDARNLSDPAIQSKYSAYLAPGVGSSTMDHKVAATFAGDLVGAVDKAWYKVGATIGNNPFDGQKQDAIIGGTGDQIKQMVTKMGKIRDMFTAMGTYMAVDLGQLAVNAIQDGMDAQAYSAAKTAYDQIQNAMSNHAHGTLFDLFNSHITKGKNGYDIVDNFQTGYNKVWNPA